MEGRLHAKSLSSLRINMQQLCCLQKLIDAAAEADQQAGIESRQQGPGTVSHCSESSMPGMDKGVLKSSSCPERGKSLWVCVCRVMGH